MDNVSVRDAREFLNLSVERPRMHLLDEPTGYISAMGKSNLGHQMRYSVDRLEAELAAGGEPACSSWSAKPTSATHSRGRSTPTASSAPTEPASSPVRASARRPARSWACAVKPCAPPPPLPQQARLRPTAHRPQNSGGGSGRLSSSKSITTDNDR